ncbi:MAG TPA: tol-pal system-associated acyl-CoA thioesterase [Gammaproteobacteria bacterium]|nr:tol-pal system-associated acyl-CoA thioesterase [Gammaproteobacteria bacterium]
MEALPAIQAHFQWAARVYWEDTDAGGVVYHATYLRFMERARTEWLRNLGVGQRARMEAGQPVFAVRRMTLDFHAPARLDDLLCVTVSADRRRGASLDLTQHVFREDGTLLVSATVQVVCIDSRFRPVRMPPDLLETLSNGT